MYVCLWSLVLLCRVWQLLQLLAAVLVLLNAVFVTLAVVGWLVTSISKGI